MKGRLHRLRLPGEGSNSSSLMRTLLAVFFDGQLEYLRYG